MNLLLPQSLERKILHTVFPFTARDQGFPAYYDRCTARDFRRVAAASGLAVEVCKTIAQDLTDRACCFIMISVTEDMRT